MFITTLESDITKLKGKKLEAGDIEMMLRRLKIFRFHAELTEPMKVADCAHCFARLLLGEFDVRGEFTHCQTPRPSKRNVPFGHTGYTPEAKRRVDSWTVEEVASFIDGLRLSHVRDNFLFNGVDGQFLLQLSEEDLVSELGLTRLQARLVKSRLQ